MLSELFGSSSKFRAYGQTLPPSYLSLVALEITLKQAAPYWLPQQSDQSVQTQPAAMNLMGGLCALIGQLADINDQLATVFRSINLYLYFAN